MVFNNFEGLPIDKYLTVGSYPYLYYTEGRVAQNIARDIDVICWEKDIKTKYKRKDDYCARFEYCGKQIECLLVDKQESLQKFLDKFPAPCPELSYIMIQGHIDYPSKKFLHFLEMVNALSQMFDMTPEIEELIELHKKTTKERKSIRNYEIKEQPKKYISRKDLYSIITYEGYNRSDMIDKNTGRFSEELWNAATKVQKIVYAMEDSLMLALESKIVPQLYENKPGMSAKQAFNWGMMLAATGYSPAPVRKFIKNNYNHLLGNYDGSYIKDFIKYCDNEYKNSRTEQGIEVSASESSHIGYKDISGRGAQNKDQ